MSNSLKINLTILPEEGLRLTFSEGAAWFKECFCEDERPEFSLIKVDVNCIITKSGDTIYVRGELAAKIKSGSAVVVWNRRQFPLVETLFIHWYRQRWRLQKIWNSPPRNLKRVITAVIL